MKRRLFTVLAALSLLLFVAMLVLWVRSRSGIDFAQLGTREDAGENLLCRDYDVSVPRGRLAFVYVMVHADRRFTDDEWYEPGVRWGRRHSASVQNAFGIGDDQGYGSSPHPTLDWMGFYFDWDDGLDTVGEVIVPLWVPMVMSGILPLAWGWKCIRHRSRAQENRCPSCGYDLRATPKRCPECGAVATEASA